MPGRRRSKKRAGDICENVDLLGVRCLVGDLPGYPLAADHIEGWSNHPELRFDLDNGRALCYDHHYLKTYGYVRVGSHLDPNRLEDGVRDASGSAITEGGASIY